MTREGGSFTVGELLDRAFYTLRTSWSRILPVPALIVSLPAAASSPVLQRFTPTDPALVGPDFWIVFSLYLAATAFTWSVASAAVSWQVHESQRGRRVGVGEALRRGSRDLVRLAWTLLVVAGACALAFAGIVTAAGIFAAVLIGAVMLAVRYVLSEVPEALAAGIGFLALVPLVPVLAVAAFGPWIFVVFPQVVALEKRSGGAALRRVWSLTTGFRVRLALLQLGLLFLLGTFTTLQGYALRLYGDVVSYVVLFPVGVAVTSYMLVVQTLFYLGLRAHKEGYDLELLASAVERDGDARHE